MKLSSHCLFVTTISTLIFLPLFSSNSKEWALYALQQRQTQSPPPAPIETNYKRYPLKRQNAQKSLYATTDSESKASSSKKQTSNLSHRPNHESSKPRDYNSDTDPDSESEEVR